MFKKITLAFCVAAVVATSVPFSAYAGPLSVESAVTRVGLGQEDAKSPSKIGNLKLSDPLVQQKYISEPDMLRFLRGSYAEACTRGLVQNAAKEVVYDRKGKYPEEARKASGRVLEANRIWKMTSFEMEALFGSAYLTSANYCDCLMKEVTDADVVHPKKGLEVIEKMPENVVRACEQIAQDQTNLQMERRKKLDGEIKAAK